MTEPNHPPEPEPPQLEAGDPDRDAILRRRERFVASELAGLTGGAPAATPAEGAPRPCLSVPPRPCLQVARHLDVGPEPEAPPAAARRRRWIALAAALLLLPPVAVFAGVGPLQHGPEPSLSDWSSAVPAAVESSAAPTAGADEDGDGLDDALEVEVARRHAPRLRFAARDPLAPSCVQNQDERYFPMSVAGFLACLDAGVWRLDRGVVSTGGPGRIEEAAVSGFPSRVVGDPVGEAPLYTHVSPTDAPGELLVEYWVFYGFDVADGGFLGVSVSWGDHRGDWEHTAYRVALDPPRVLEGFYFGHDRGLAVPGEDLEVVEGLHPVVYVSQGKHASYPAACRVASTVFPGWVVQHQDVANGLGPRWDTWRGRLVDLGERGKPRPEVARWFPFLGRWGQDGLVVGTLEVGTSATGPAAKPEWGKSAGGRPWREALRELGGTLLPPPD
ncbi:MAG: Vps62-related protein [Planctomycetota bacterium]